MLLISLKGSCVTAFRIEIGHTYIDHVFSLSSRSVPFRKLEYSDQCHFLTM